MAIPCPKCKYFATYVREVWKQYRRRQCPKCSEYFITHERSVRWPKPSPFTEKRRTYDRRLTNPAP